MGWTQMDLTQVPEEMLYDPLVAAYGEVAPQKLADELLAMLKQKAAEKGEDWY
jgi:hypothetical protein